MKAAVGRRRSTPGNPPGPLVSDSFLRPSFTLEQIRTFLAVASREHVTHAAQVLRLSQPAVTQQVQLLERALGVRLLERVGRSVRLTGAGVEVAGACLLIMRALENLENVVQAVRGLDLGSVSIGASHLAATYFLPSIITDFVAAHPRINVGVVVGDADDVCHQVASGQLECGLIEGAPNPPGAGLVRARVAATEVVIVTHPRHLAYLRANHADDLLCGTRYLVWGPGSAIETLAAELLGDQYEGTPRLQIGSMEAARRSLLHAPGFVAAMPSVAVKDDLGAGALVRVCPQNSAALPVFAVRRRGPDSPAVEALWQALIRRKAAPGG
ncbi:MAG TPA: LysR family transcriptional regulator [Micromonosporaceae bacterium]|nr:LysR family transcriptional regulator [Micromonosporaceae bacterium]